MENLVQLVEASYGFVEIAGEDEKCHERAGVHFAGDDLVCSKASDEEQSAGGNKFHAGLVERPGFHHGERGLAHAVAGLVETGVFACLAGVGFDLADAGDVVVE